MEIQLRNDKIIREKIILRGGGCCDVGSETGLLYNFLDVMGIMVSLGRAREDFDGILKSELGHVNNMDDFFAGRNNFLGLRKFDSGRTGFLLLAGSRVAIRSKDRRRDLG